MSRSMPKCLGAFDDPPRVFCAGSGEAALSGDASTGRGSARIGMAGEAGEAGGGMAAWALLESGVLGVFAAEPPRLSIEKIDSILPVSPATRSDIVEVARRRRPFEPPSSCTALTTASLPPFLSFVSVRWRLSTLNLAEMALPHSRRSACGSSPGTDIAENESRMRAVTMPISFATKRTS